MKQEDKQLLLKDLCARLPYQPLCKKVDTEDNFCECDVPLGYSLRDLVNNKIIIKPYLRPMSSMTTEEICKIENIIGDGFTYRGGTLTLSTEEIIKLPIYKISNLIQFIYSRHLDFNNLISMSLALEAPEEMYNLKVR